MRRLFLLAINGVRVLFLEGPGSFARKTRNVVRTRIRGLAVHLPVGNREATLVDWTIPQPGRPHITVKDGPLRVAWIMSPPSATSGGHQNLFRFIDVVEQAGHRCAVHFYTSTGVVVDIADMMKMLETTAAYPNVRASLQNYDRNRGVGDDVHAIFATGWETAYPAYLDRSAARRFYFVQDFEPTFYAAGTEAVLAENTYRFGFHGITAGRWLATKLADEYGMPTDFYDFGADPGRYHPVNTRRRDEIFFYARPPTARRGFELGVLALADFAEAHPDVTINFAGWDVSNFHLPFEVKNHSGLSIDQLNELYNRCAAGLVLSFSNMSLLPLELLASGVIPVVNDAPNTRMVVDNPFISFVPPVPKAISRALSEALERSDQEAHAAAAAASVAEATWARSGKQFLTAFEGRMRG